MKHSKEYQLQLMNEWFDGKYYLKITKTKDKQAFFDYISLYDMRFANYKAESQRDEGTTMYYAWRFCEGLHHDQLEYTSDSNYWDGVCLEYDDVKDYVSEFGLGYQNMQKITGGLTNENNK